jgi:beta-mannosidase
MQIIVDVNLLSPHLCYLLLQVNGRPLFAKGQNWMPGSVLIADDATDAANKQARLADLAAVGGNTVRIWGGGIYETHAFYKAADELGLMVMQDGSFFGVYPKDVQVGGTHW